MPLYHFLNDVTSLEYNMPENNYIKKYFFIFLIFIIVVLQSITLAILLKIIYFTQHLDLDLDLYNYNSSEANEYINKTKTIINYICHNLVTC